MAFREIAEDLAKTYPDGTTERFKKLDAFDRLLKGTFYDHIKNAFSAGDDPTEDYIPLLKRRPNVIYNIAKVIVDQTSGAMWGDEQMPFVRCSRNDEDRTEQRLAAEQSIAAVVEHCELDAVMLEIYEMGTTGSVGIIVRADDDDLPYFEAVPGKNARPIFDPHNPRRLIGLQQVYVADTTDLIAAGFEVKPDETYWMRIELDAIEERRFEPLIDEDYQRLGQKRTSGPKAGQTIEWILDEEFAHGWGIVPAIWVTNLVGGDGTDGPCTFGAIVDMIVELDYTISQNGRGWRYAADPMLAIQRGELVGGGGRRSISPDGDEDNDITGRDSSGAVVKSPTNILDVPAGGDAKLLEITGNGLKGALDYAKQLREWALEVVGGLKASAEQTKGVPSGRALELIQDTLLLIIKRQRIAYGTRGLVPLVRLLMVGIQRGAVAIPDAPPIGTDVPMRLVWPSFRTPKGAELLAFAQAVETLAGGSGMSPVPILPRDLLTSIAANELNAADPASVVEQLDTQTKADDAKAKADAAEAAALAAANAPKPTPPKPKKTPTGA